MIVETLQQIASRLGARRPQVPGHAARVRWTLLSLGLALGLQLIGSAAHPAPSLSPEARRDLELRPGVVLIFIPLKGSIPELHISCPDGMGVMGSGFIFRPDGYILTNGHVTQLANVKDADAKSARTRHIASCLADALKARLQAERQQQGKPPLTDKELQAAFAQVQQYLQQGKITIDEGQATVRVCLDNHQCMNGEIKAYSDPFIEADNPGKDVSIIKVDAHDLPTVPLGNSDAVRVQDAVEVIGFPGDATISSISTFVATSTEGIVSAVKRLDRPDMQVLQTSAIINPGNSGGPAFDRQGRVIGIATFKSGESYNYLVPLSVALEFVRGAGIEPQRGNFDELWGKALTAFSDGDWSQAHKLLQDTLEMLPNQPEAERLLRESAANERSQKPLDSALHGMSGIAGIGAAVVVLALALWFFMRKRGATVAPAGGSGHAAVMSGQILPGATTRVITPPAAAAPTAALTNDNFGSLHASGGPLAGNRFPITKEGVLIGRDPARCRVVVPEDAVSGEHAWVVPLDNGVVLIDRNSSNGTYLNSPNSSRVSKVLLRHGDRIYLGASTATVLTYHSA